MTMEANFQSARWFQMIDSDKHCSRELRERMKILAMVVWRGLGVGGGGRVPSGYKLMIIHLVLTSIQES